MNTGLKCMLAGVLGLITLLAASQGIAGLTPHQNEINDKLHSLTVPFVENQGQKNDRVAYYAATFVGNVWITRSGEIVVAVDGQKNAPATVIKEILKGAIPVKPRGETLSPTRINAFRGNDPAKWRRGIPAYDSLSMGQVYPGIGLTLSAHANNVEKIFEVAPGADPGQIQITLSGADRLALSGKGELTLFAGKTTLSFTKPVAYQRIGGKHQPVEVAYSLYGNTYGFKLGPYDQNHPLIIDPMFSTYLGGSDMEYGYALDTNTIDSELYIYVVGYTNSTDDFPGLTGVQTEHGRGDRDAFVARLDMDLRVLETTYLGGSGEDESFDIAIYPENNNVYVTGWTDSNNFPTVPGAMRGRGAGFDAFISCLTPDLATLVQSRYLGGELKDNGIGIAIAHNPEPDPLPDAIYLAGSTLSTDFPGTTGSAQTTHGSPGGAYTDGFIARLGTDLVLMRASYLGGNSVDHGNAVAVHDTSNEVYVTGNTSYNGREGIWVGSFPWLDPSAFGGQVDGFVVRMDYDLTEVLNATYIGGSAIEFSQAIAINHSTYQVFVAGGFAPRYVDGAWENNFPGIDGFQTEIGGEQDGFIVSLDPDLTLVHGTHLGGYYFERISDILLSNPNSPAFDVYVSGSTRSADLPGIEDGAGSRKGGQEAFVARFNSTLDALYQTTYVGGTSRDESLAKGLSRALNPSSGGIHIFLAGSTESSDFPGVLYTDTDNSAQPTFGGRVDAFVTRLSATLELGGSADIELQPRTHDFGNNRLSVSTLAKIFTIENMGGDDLAVSNIELTGDDATDYAIAPDAGIAACGGAPFLVAPGVTCTFGVVFTPTVDNDMRNAEMIVTTSNDPDEPELRVTLQGYSGPDIDLEPADPGQQAALRFPMAEIGTTITQSFTIYNRGYSDLVITNIQKTGIAPDTGEDFTLVYGGDYTCPDPSSGDFTLPAFNSCTVGVDFSPTVVGPQEGVVVIHSNDLDENPTFMTLTGTGVEDLSADIHSYDLPFHDVPVGESFSLPLIITNVGGQDLQILDTSLSDELNFSYDDSGGAIPCAAQGGLLPPVSSCTMTVTFNPQVAGTFAEALTISSNDPDEPMYTVQLTGRSDVDSDGDGVLDIEEAGDANDDATPDANQADVATLHSREGDHYAIFQVADGAELREVRARRWPSDVGLAGYSLPYGFYGFKVVIPPTANGANVTVSLFNADGTPVDSIDSWVKYGPEPGNAGHHYYDLNDYAGPVTINGTEYPTYVEIAGNVITLHLVDGGAGDHDDSDGDGRGEVNLEILDPGAPAIKATATDSDGDGVLDDVDNCPGDENPGQENQDGDSLGDACDACPNDADNDTDSDGVCGDVDNCPGDGNPGQENQDGDSLGDACDTCPNDADNDTDNDGVCGDVDNCPGTANPGQEDDDSDGVGDACEASGGGGGGGCFIHHLTI